MGNACLSMPVETVIHSRRMDSNSSSFTINDSLLRLQCGRDFPTQNTFEEAVTQNDSSFVALSALR